MLPGAAPLVDYPDSDSEGAPLVDYPDSDSEGAPVAASVGAPVAATVGSDEAMVVDAYEAGANHQADSLMAAAAPVFDYYGGLSDEVINAQFDAFEAAANHDSLMAAAAPICDYYDGLSDEVLSAHLDAVELERAARRQADAMRVCRSWRNAVRSNWNIAS
jgi:hypothetical protein